jgi:streptomycin 3"-adenylyltransferase
VAECATSALGEALVGVILHGSATTDDFVPGQSDIDVLVIAEGPIEDSTAADLLACVAAAGREPATNVDLRVVTRESAAPERSPELELEIAVRIGRIPQARVQTRRGRERDLLVEYSVCRQHGIALAGPDAVELIGEVPMGWLREVGVAQLRNWQMLDFEPRYSDLMVFTACRIWRLAAEGRHCSKTAAAEWVLMRRPDLDVVRAAVQRRAQRSDAELREEQGSELLSSVLEHIL